MTNPRRIRARALAIALLGLVVLLCASVIPARPPSAVLAQDSDEATAQGAWSQSFDGRPGNPTPWNPPDWDIQVHSRDESTFKQLTPMAAHHGGNCSAPPDSHITSSYEDAVFQCNDHVMTAINASGYGVIYLTPNQLVDFSAGEAVVRFDMSTFRSSGRDWTDVWLSPFEDQLALPWRGADPDLTGPPRRAIHLDMIKSDGETFFSPTLTNNFTQYELPNASKKGYETFLTPSAVRRDTFELRVSRTSLKFGMPDYNVWWVDQKFNDIGWDKAVLQLGHHSYNPTKDCPASNPCFPNTWHWDNVSISSPKPFTMLKADQAYVDNTSRPYVTFPSGAPPGTFLRFAAIGNSMDVSFDGGRTFYPANNQAASDLREDHFRGYWTPVPEGITRVDFRGTKWYGGDWIARGIALWSLTTDAPPVAIAPTATATSVPPTATATTVPAAPTLTAVPPTATTIVAGCTPRPSVSVQTQPAGADHLQVTVQVGRPANMPNNRLRSVQFLRASSANVSAQGQTITSNGGTVTPPAGSTSLGFMVNRQPPGSKAAVTVPFVVNDDCGGWSTFVGGGGTAF